MGRFLTLVWAIGGGIGYAGGTALVVISIIKCLFRDPRTVSAEEYRSKRIAGRREKPGRFNPDLGWPIYQFYPFRQVNIDVRRTGVELLKRYGRVWRWLFDAYFRGRHGPRFLWWLFLFIVPLSIGLFALLLFGTVASTLSYGFFVATSVVCVAASFAVAWPASVLLRRAEAYRRRVRFTDASCPSCYLVTPWPAYQCSGCNETHHDLRRGRLGVLHRRCGCGARPSRLCRCARPGSCTHFASAAVPRSRSVRERCGTSVSRFSAM